MPAALHCTALCATPCKRTMPPRPPLPAQGPLAGRVSGVEPWQVARAVSGQWDSKCTLLHWVPHAHLDPFHTHARTHARTQLNITFHTHAHAHARTLARSFTYDSSGAEIDHMFIDKASWRVLRWSCNALSLSACAHRVRACPPTHPCNVRS